MPDGAGAAPFLPYGRQTIEDDDLAAVVAALKSDFLTTGPLVDRFEAALAQAVGAEHAVVCSNGTTALHLAVHAAGVKPGDVCVVPAITFVATANCARYQGADVVFADVDPATGLMTADTLTEALTRVGGRPLRAVLPVHLAGNTVDTAAVRKLAEAAGAVVIEDACHAVGTRTPAGPVGACADSVAACFSFHPVKTIATGEGGAITTNDAEFAARMRRARSHGIERADFSIADGFDDGRPNPWWYEQVELGWNYRLPDVLCALGVSQIAKLDRFVARRRFLAGRYRELLAPYAPLVRTVATPAGCEPALHLLQVRIDFEAAGLSRREVAERLRARGIGSQVHYIPVHRQPYYRGLYGEQVLPGADAFYASTLSLPLYPGMGDEDPARVVEAVAAVLGLQS
ncbi:UDP-4-amino-4,6-dideoxy-N-acetyl-beta-L-altrosamine transaminase [Caulobacter sp. 17J80-11]|uniref:UDP-4-amino-4, 6-dideoxy-N-acetyl-beta-L-altrosamine transaminase n=1 Tax=Caulobacter sp. 17J80-11 TaxID=2763502 RepID=UPI001653B4EB|nr:UDP-4-amino-4,6-dideoxy-N-acetyl-beta-L-altrosamine transaminase [Caulobacter sp. 17J80-11]MBC6983660.1 UDP-4-amino-4,6-dideoxy-N-acetyl-beta-L-altrosamine transaminase [Caulobacter sp. 17J80-11]